MNPTVIEAYAKLGVSRAVVATHPRITPQLRKIGKMLERLNLNLPRDPYFYLSASEHPDARAIIAARASIARYFTKLLPIEAFCVAAAVPTPRVLEMVTVAAMRMGAQASTMLAALSHPDVVKKTIEVALTDAGTDDRAVLHKATGFLPTPRGSQTQITIPINASSSASAQATSQVANVSAPAPENTIRRLSERLNLRRAQPMALPQSSAMELPEDSESVEPELIQLHDLEGEEVDDLD
jgi:hypothetical protein